jgi:hypothetical protein
MDPSVQPFYSNKRSTRPRRGPVFAPQPPQPAFVRRLPSSQAAASYEANAIQPSHHSEQFETYQQPPQPPMSTQLSFQVPPQLSGQHVPAPIHNPEALVADMWRTCPALCRSIRQDFDLNAIFHPALLAQHGETFLRLAASQIAMQNQAAEMTHMRNAILQKQKLLEVNTASTKDLQQKLVTQQSELKEIRRLLEQQSQSHTNPGAVDNGQARSDSFRDNDPPSEGVTVAPPTPALTVTAVERPIHNFYSRSASLASLKVSLPPDDVDKHDEKHGYGHAETKGPTLQYEEGEDCVPNSQWGFRQVQPISVAPMVSTSPIFEPVESSAKPVVSIGPKKQTARGPDNREQLEGSRRTTFGDQTSATKDMIATAAVTIMKREKPHKPASPNPGNPEKTIKSETPKQERATAPVTPPSTNESQKHSHEGSITIPPSKSVSYAAAVRTTPATPSNDEPSTLKQTPTTSQNSPAPDLGFTLEPLPKPTVRQVQSQLQQAQPADNHEFYQTPTNAAFDFNEWKQRKIAAGTWQDRMTDQPHTQHHPKRSFHNNSMYRGRGSGDGSGGWSNHHNNENFRPGRFHHHNNFRSGAASQEERKQEWLTWKQGLVEQGKWNPQHPFREAWKNE